MRQLIELAQGKSPKIDEQKINAFVDSNDYKGLIKYANSNKDNKQKILDLALIRAVSAVATVDKKFDNGIIDVGKTVNVEAPVKNTMVQQLVGAGADPYFIPEKGKACAVELLASEINLIDACLQDPQKIHPQCKTSTLLEGYYYTRIESEKVFVTREEKSTKVKEYRDQCQNSFVVLIMVMRKENIQSPIKESIKVCCTLKDKELFSMLINAKNGCPPTEIENKHFTHAVRLQQYIEESDNPKKGFKKRFWDNISPATPEERVAAAKALQNFIMFGEKITPAQKAIIKGDRGEGELRDLYYKFKEENKVRGRVMVLSKDELENNPPLTPE